MQEDQNGKKIKDVAVKVLKTTLKMFTKKWVIIAILFIMIIVLLGGVYNALMDAFSDKVSNYTAENPVQYDTSDNSIVISDEQAKELMKQLEKMGFSLDSLHLTEDLIKKCYAAEVVSQELNRGVQEQEGKYYGRVYVKKAYSEDSSTNDAKSLTYVPYEKMQGEGGIPPESIDGKDIADCFSVTPEGKIVIVSKTITTDEDGKVTTERKLNELEYKSKISKYITPFEFLIDLCVATQNPEYVSTLAEKIVKETSIVIMIMDNVTTVDTTKTYKYKNATSVDEEGRIYTKDEENGQYSDSGRRDPKRGNPKVTLPSEESEYISEDSKNSSIEAHNPAIQITSVDTWFVKQNLTYNNKTDGPTEDTAFELIDDEIPKHTEESYKESYTVEETEGTLEEVRMYVSTIKYKVDQKIEIVTKVTINTFSESTSEQTDAEGKIEEILEMLKDRYKLPNSTLSQAPIYKLENGAEIFFNMLQKSSRTQELEKIMRYVLYLHSGKSYGVTELNFNIFNIRDFNTVLGIDALKSFIRYFEGTKEEGGQYVVYKDTGGNRTVGYGINIEAQKAKFIARGIDPSTIKEGDKFDKEIIDSMEDETITGMKNSVEAATSGLNLKSYQIMALVSRFYNCGNISGFKDAYNKYWKETDDEYGVAENSSMYVHPLYKNYMSTPIKDNKGNTLAGLVTRRKAEWLLFKTGYNIATKQFVPEGGAIVEWAQVIHQYMEANDYIYCVYGTNGNEECNKLGRGACYLSATFEGSKASAQTRKTCCATFVSWVLQEAGYMTADEHNSNYCNGANDLARFLENQKGFRRVIKSELTAGDIIVCSGHVEIYAGDNQVYNAGSGNAIRGAAPSSYTSLNRCIYGLRAP